MRRTARLLASVKPARFLEPNTPTGLTGLLTHPSPRPTLIFLYNSTLEKLKALPSSSLYRQSTEALTNHRLKVIESVIPAGFEEWSARAKKTMEENPEFFDPKHPEYTGQYKTMERNGKKYVEAPMDVFEDGEDELEWDGEPVVYVPEGSRTAEERAFQGQIAGKRPITDLKSVRWEPEPPLDTDQISDIEHKIGAGLIEEVIQVAEGELKLVDVMAKSKVWEELEEKPAEGQWTYFSRDTSTNTTQTPPKQ